MIGHKGHIADYHGMLRPPDHGLDVMDHLIHGYRDSGFIAQHYHTQAVANQDQGHPSLVYNLSEGIIIGG